MSGFLAVVAAGAIGAVARAWAGWAVGRAWRRAGAGTLAVNLTGAFLAGVVLGAGERWPVGVASAVAVGFLGAFTTFSTWTAELHARWRAGGRWAVGLEAAATLAAGVGLAALGAALAR